MPDGQINFANQAGSTESGQGFSELDESGLDGGGLHMSLVMTGPPMLGLAGRPVLLETAQPLARGEGRCGKKSRGELDATLAGVFDEPQAMVVSVSFHESDRNSEPPSRERPDRCTKADHASPRKTSLTSSRP